uniref:Uncharacterized protein n=1 Tax=Solanum tuberosum TaxID=4113 RepID=M1ATI7_SOLTU
MYWQPGIVVRNSSISSSLLPYKKRYSVLYPDAPIHPSRDVDPGVMPVSGNEEPGVVARQSSISSSLLPYKKRYCLLYPHETIHPSRNVEDLVKPALAEKLAVKKEVVSKQGDSRHIELPLGPKKVVILDGGMKKNLMASD